MNMNTDQPNRLAIVELDAGTQELVGGSLRIGQGVAALQIFIDDSIVRNAGLGFEHALGEKLESANLGMLSHLNPGQPVQIFFLIWPRRSTQFLDLLKTELERLNIADNCSIFSMTPEGADRWIRFYPPEAPAVEKRPG
jgi:hypothetical protein